MGDAKNAVPARGRSLGGDTATVEAAEEGVCGRRPCDRVEPALAPRRRWVLLALPGRLPRFRLSVWRARRSKNSVQDGGMRNVAGRGASGVPAKES